MNARIRHKCSDFFTSDQVIDERTGSTPVPTHVARHVQTFFPATSVDVESTFTERFNAAEASPTSPPRDPTASSCGGGTLATVDGTRCSSSVFASVVSLLKASAKRLPHRARGARTRLPESVLALNWH